MSEVSNQASDSLSEAYKSPPDGLAGHSLGVVPVSAFPRALPGMEAESVRLDDIVLTPIDIARDVVNHFKPSGRILDPCRGNGAFADLMPGCEWCEIRQGRDFYAWREPVDWIVSNPPYSVFADFLRHSLTVAKNIVYLIPVNKIFNSDRMMREIWTWGGVPEIYTVAGGGALGFPIGFAIGAVHFRRAYRGETRVTFRTPNSAVEPQKCGALLQGGIGTNGHAQTVRHCRLTPCSP